MFRLVLFAFFGLGSLAFIAVVVLGVVSRVRRRDRSGWQDEPNAGDPPKVRPGPGWGNGGSWN